MPWRVILTVTMRKRMIHTSGPLTWEEANALAMHLNMNQLEDSWQYGIQPYDLQCSDKQVKT